LPSEKIFESLQKKAKMHEHIYI